MSTIVTRRRLIGSLGVGAGGLLLSGCDRISASPSVRNALKLGENASYGAQRLIADRSALAPEFGAADMSPIFRTNGNDDPQADDYLRHVGEHFANWRLTVDGMFARPMSLSLDQIRAAPRRTQVTRHDCVEGWSAIGQWTGLPLGLLLRSAGLSSNARFVVFHCADDFDGTPYYESIDLIDAMHLQTILAWGMNGQMLPVGHGAPLRLRVERQLGYKQAKYVMRVQAVATLAGLGCGKGGYWGDVADYQWYAGI